MTSSETTMSSSESTFNSSHAHMAPCNIHKIYAGLHYAVILKPDDSQVYLDIDKLGLHNHAVHTTCTVNDWEALENEGDRAASTIIDLHNAAPKGFL